ncbi:hypothetical protein B0H13DRAFT_1873839 [Mycena leptocephala]|nr:hypothetical protein B0H13DRAFT_1873839 [Mycena leptocephala]
MIMIMIGELWAFSVDHESLSTLTVITRGVSAIKLDPWYFWRVKEPSNGTSHAMTSQLTTSVRKLPGRCTGTTSWSNEHDVTAYWNHQPGRALGTTSPDAHSHAEQRHQCRHCRDRLSSAQPTMVKEQIKRTTGNSQRAMRAQTSKKPGTAKGILGTANGKLG